MAAAGQAKKATNEDATNNTESNFQWGVCLSLSYFWPEKPQLKVHGLRFWQILATKCHWKCYVSARWELRSGYDEQRMRGRMERHWRLRSKLIVRVLPRPYMPELIACRADGFFFHLRQLWSAKKNNVCWHEFQYWGAIVFLARIRIYFPNSGKWRDGRLSNIYNFKM